MKKYYVAYLRKSTRPDDRQAASIEKQKRAIELLQKEKGLKIIRYYEEKGTAWIDGQHRLAFDAMISDIQLRDDIIGIVAFDTDRLARNGDNTDQIKKLIIRGNITEIMTTQGEIFNENNLGNLSMKEVFGFEYSHKISRNVRSSIKDRTSQGIPLYIMPGYRWDPEAPKGKKKPVFNAYMPLMRKIFEQFMTGNFSVEAIKRKTEELGIKNTQGRSISTSAMFNILKSPYYTGRFNYPKNSENIFANQNSYEPILSDEEHDLILRILNDKSKPRKQRYTFALNGILTCGECGAKVYGDEKEKPNGKIYRLYGHNKKKHNCHQGWVNEKDLEPQVEEYLKKIELDPDFVKWSFKWLSQLNKSETETREAARKSLQESYSSVVKKLDNLLELKLEMGDAFDTQEFVKKQQKLLHDKDNAKSNLDKIDKRIDEWQELTLRTFIFCETAPERFRTGTVEDKKFILKMIGSNAQLLNRKVRIIGRKPFRLVEKALLDIGGHSNGFQPKESVVFSANTPSSLVESTVGRDRRDSDSQPLP